MVDTSLSMSVQDIADGKFFRSRLDAAQELMRTTIAQDDAPSAHAILSFARYATLQTPFTEDISHLENIITGLTPTPYGGGTDITEALKTASHLYKNTQNLSIIILTDGEFFEADREYFPFLAGTNMLWIGVGTPSGGRILQGYDTSGRPLYREFRGEVVVSHASPEDLQKYSAHYGGQADFLTTTEDSVRLTRDIQEFLQQEARQHIDPRIVIGVVLILAGLIFPQYRYTSSHAPS